MSREIVLARGRAAAEKGMTDTCTIRRITGSTTDPNSGVISPSYATLFIGSCRVQQAQAQAQQTDAGEAYLLLLRLEVQLPMSLAGLRVSDEITIDTSAHDPDLVDRVFLVRDLAHGTHKTARRVQVTEKTS